MYIYIIQAGDRYSLGITYGPSKFINDYRNNKVVGAPPYVCSMGKYVFLKRYPKGTRMKFERFFEQMRHTTVAYYAKQSSTTLIRWFNKVAGMPAPLPFELELMSDDVNYLLERHNKGMYRVKG